ncbi:MAG: O-succinylhomoserine (thiol)-lyase [Kaistia sp. SCN 65-12]|nr:MAG: O-succinylhomoserine (thiol)-lyase [Kaistia sp. SCN 65-12]
MTDCKSPETIAAANGIGQDAAFGAVVPPLYLSSAYRFRGFEQPGAYEYSRTRNPTRDQLADTLAKLEGGAGAVITSSGMAAVDLVLSRLEPDDLVLAPHDCYGGTFRLLQRRAIKRQFKVAFVDQTDPRALDRAFERMPMLVLIETPSNPLMRVVDIAGIVRRARTISAAVAVDNTFLSPAVQRPIGLGADFVIHSTTKYLNGHSDMVGGAVVAASAARLEELAEWANITGVTGAPFDSYQTLRGLRTLFPRLERQQKTAMAVAQFLDAHPRVARVHFPGLATHPGHELARRQQDGFGAMLSFEIEGGMAEIRRFSEALRIFTLAESLGGMESLAAHPATMTHAGMGPEARHAAGIKDTLMRLSIGLEGEQDLLDDLQRALEAAGGEP